MHRRQPARAATAWAVSISVHGGLAALIWLLPAQAKPPSVLPPVEIIDRKLPKRKKPEPPPDKKEAEPPPPAKAPVRVAMTRKLPPRTERQPPPETSKEPAKEPTPEDTGPKVFGERMQGGVTAPPGQGIPIPQGDSMRVSPRVTQKGKAPEKKTTGFKKDYSVGEEAPVAVITAYPKVLKQVTVDYPERMKELGIEGKVVLELTVSATGKVASARLVKSLHAELDKLALAAAKQLLFSPAFVGKTAVQVKIPYTFTFVLD